MDGDQLGGRNQDRVEGLLEGQQDEYYMLEAAQQGSSHYPPTTSEAAAVFLRSLMMDALPENREPIPPFEDYAPDPIFFFLKNCAQHPHPSQSAIQPLWPAATTFELLNQRDHSNSFQQHTHTEGVKIQPFLQQELKVEEIEPVEFQKRSLGGLTYAERREKIDRYLEKRRRRSFTKKVAYDCRKKVADQRIRVKGRFVTRKQALEILELPQGEYSEEYIKKLLLDKLANKKALANHA